MPDDTMDSETRRDRHRMPLIATAVMCWLLAGQPLTTTRAAIRPSSASEVSDGTTVESVSDESPSAAAESPSDPDPPQWSSAARMFALQIQPLLQKRCWACHGAEADTVEGELDLTSRVSAMRGGSSGAVAVIPGNADGSLVVQLASGRDPDRMMPPKETERLRAQEIEILRQWIDEGAAWPNAEEVARIQTASASGRTVTTSGGLSADWNSRRYQPQHLWAWQPLPSGNALPSTRTLPTSQTLPKTKAGPHGIVSNAGTDRSDTATGSTEPGVSVSDVIDAFIDQRLQSVGLEAAPRADRRTLIRRVTFNLIGLPPTPDDVQKFLQDPRDDKTAFAAVVDRLLQDPAYGEHWARHWLDVVRYADTAGLANDFERPNAWRYRDYIVRSFNADKPYDQFVREQIAGDEIAPDSSEHLIAVGFLRMGPWEQTGMSVARQTRQQFLDDVTDMVGQVFLSTPLQCCRCHDHKFDPVPTRDYYRIQAVFATTQFADRDAAFLPEENTADVALDRRILQEHIRDYQKTLDALNQKNVAAEKQWYAERNLPYVPRNEIPRKSLPPEQIAPRHLGLTTEDFGVERVCRKNLVRHRWELDRYQPYAFSVYSGPERSLTNVSSRIALPQNFPESVPDHPDANASPAKPAADLPSTHILIGGSLDAPAEAVEPGVLSGLEGLRRSDTQSSDSIGPDSTESGSNTEDVGEATQLTASVNGRRTELAQWITDAENGLAMRSIVNRVWGWHFGKAIAGNPNNFGQTGRLPTHPELLDWMCQQFVSDGRSFKTLHRQILLTDAWCRDSRHPHTESLSAVDPENDSLAVFPLRRLSAEELRDAILAVSGELNLQIGGVPVRPEMNQEAALQPRQIMGTYAPAWQPSPLPEQRHRRTIYTMNVRGLRDPMLEVFNQPSPDLSCERRESSTVTTQVFSLLNADAMQHRALAFAARLLNTPEAPPEEAARQNAAQTEPADAPRTDVDVIRDAFRRAFARIPEPEELSDCLSHWHQMTERHTQLTFQIHRPPVSLIRHAIEEMNGEPFSFTEQLHSNRHFIPDLQHADCSPRLRGLAEVCLVLLNANEFLYVD